MHTQLTDAEWREFQDIPEQGYSHRGWIEAHLAKAYAQGRVDGINDCLPMIPTDDSGHLTATRDFYEDRT